MWWHTDNDGWLYKQGPAWRNMLYMHKWESNYSRDHSHIRTNVPSLSPPVTFSNTSVDGAALVCIEYTVGFKTTNQSIIMNHYHIWPSLILIDWGSHTEFCALILTFYRKITLSGRSPMFPKENCCFPPLHFPSDCTIWLGRKLCLWRISCKGAVHS